MSIPKNHYFDPAPEVASKPHTVRLHTADLDLELPRANAEAAGVANVTVAAPDDVPDGVRFAAIYSNPPVRIGKAAMHEILDRWLDRLAPGGTAYLVVQRNLGSDSLAAWLAE